MPHGSLEGAMCICLYTCCISYIPYDDVIPATDYRPTFPAYRRINVIYDSTAARYTRISISGGIRKKSSLMIPELAHSATFPDNLQYPAIMMPIIGQTYCLLYNNTISYLITEVIISLNSYNIYNTR